MCFELRLLAKMFRAMVRKQCHLCQKTKVVLATLIRQGGIESTTVDLDSGKMLCKPKKLIKSESFMVKTPTAVAGVRGTQFTVEADTNGTSRIKVFEGSVKVAKRVKELEAKKGLIDQQLQKMTSQLENVSKLMQDLEKDRVEKFGELAKHLQLTGEQTHSLLQTTNSLREALAGTKSRGQWGERMAEDILRLSGFMEDVNYLKQKTIEGAGSRPDFTFLLPRGMKMNMDVKFPLDNYMKYLEAGTEGEKAKCRGDFLRDVKARIKEITTRDYINPDQNTVNYVLLFIPNEQVYGFIHEQDSLILDEGMKSRVILCSPVTLFAVLAVIRQALDCFALEQTSNEILSLLGAFNKQWDLFVKKFEALGKRIEDVHKEYEGLNTTRRRQLEKPLTKIEELRKGRGIEQALSDGEIDGPEG